MSDPIAERLRLVEADWRELHRQNEMLIKINRSLEAERDRLRAELDARTPCPHSGVTLPVRMKCDLCAGKR